MNPDQPMRHQPPLIHEYFARQNTLERPAMRLHCGEQLCRAHGCTNPLCVIGQPNARMYCNECEAGPWYVHVWVKGHYSGAYQFERRSQAEADIADRRSKFGVLGIAYTLDREPPATESAEGTKSHD